MKIQRVNVGLWALCLLSFCVPSAAAQASGQASLALPLELRLDTPLNHAAVSLSLADFVSFLATSYKVPVLAEVVAPVPHVQVPAGVHTARQLLDAVIAHLPGYAWDNYNGVALVFQVQLRKADGNVLNLPTNYFTAPSNLHQFDVLFRFCVQSYAQNQECDTGAIRYDSPDDLHEETQLEISFHDAPTRHILLEVLKTSGHIYEVMAYASENPRPGDTFVFENWFTRSLVPETPAPIRIQTPGKNRK